jgi:Phage-related protein
MNWLRFKNVLSTGYGLIITDLGRRSRAEEQIDIYEIPYRNDDLIIHSNKYKPYLREVVCAVKDQYKMPEINQWLSDRGELRTSIDSGGYFIASVVTGLPYKQMMNGVDSFQVGFKVNPFFYLDSGTATIQVTQGTPINNIGTIYSEPYIKITGNGNITLTINSTVVTLTGITDYIELDSELKIAYKGTLNQGDKMVGDFPILNVGNNYFAWTGNVTKVEIIPRWREL